VGSRNPVLLVGIDGATWDVIDPMIERGELPNFEALTKRGLRGRLIAVDPLSSPVVWTTIATGRFPREHGILDFTFPYEPGTEKLLVRSSVRKVPAIWNVATEAGLSVGVVGYFASHPAETIGGIMVSDRAHQGVASSISPVSEAARITPIHEDLDRKVTMKPLHDRFIHWDYDRKALKNPDDPYHLATDVVTGRIDKRIVADEFVRRSTLEVMNDEFDLTMTYFRITDHASHVGWLYYDDTDFETKPTELDKKLLHDLIPESYRYMDEVLGDLVAKAGPDTNIILVSDHGFGSATGNFEIRRHREEELTGNHRHDGLLLAAGPDIRQGTNDRMTVVDVAPTLMALLGLPISREIGGQVEEDLFTEAFRSGYEPNFVQSYEFDWSSPDTSEEVASAEEQEALEALQALGYIGNTTASGGTSDGGFDFWAIDSRLRRRALVGEITYLLYRGDTRRSGALVRQIQQRDPKLAGRLEEVVGRVLDSIETKYGTTLFDRDQFVALFADVEAVTTPEENDESGES